ncbi:MAG: hypothetical protein Kow0099_14380 [Candidatus Abyssubacteria bacterium]
MEPARIPSRYTATPPTPAHITTTESVHFGADLLWFGANPSRTNPQVLSTFGRMVDDLGIRSVRFDVYWGLLEPQRGRYDWTLTDQLVNSVDRNTEIVFTLYSTSEWGSKYNECREMARERRGIDVYNRPPSSIPLRMSDYANFLERIVNRYEHRVKYWQIENEVYGSVFREIPKCGHVNRFWVGTTQEYLTLLRESYMTIKQADPQATVFASSFTFEPWPLRKDNPFLTYILDAGRHYTDLIDVHLYLGVHEDPEKIAWLLAKLRGLGYSKPIWSTEVGQIDIEYYGERSVNQMTSQQMLTLQAEETVKRYVLAFASGVDRVFQLRISPYTDRERESRWTHMSLTYDKMGSRKRPGYYALQTTIDKLEGFSEIKRISPTKYQFIVRGSPVFVLWTDQGQETFDMSAMVREELVRRTEPFSVEGPPTTQTERADSVRLTSIPAFFEPLE